MPFTALISFFDILLIPLDLHFGHVDVEIDLLVGKRESRTRLRNIVMRLRKCYNHPYIFEGAWYRGSSVSPSPVLKVKRRVIALIGVGVV